MPFLATLKFWLELQDDYDLDEERPRHGDLFKRFRYLDPFREMSAKSLQVNSDSLKKQRSEKKKKQFI